MSEMIIGARLHDYGKGTPYEMFSSIAKDGFRCTQLAYKKSIAGVKSYADVTPELIAETVKAAHDTNIWVAVIGAYVELAMNKEDERKKNVADFTSQLAVAKALNSACVGTETTDMGKQPAGTTRDRALYQLCKSLDEILPIAQDMGVCVGIEPVYLHSMNTVEATKRVLDSMQSDYLKVILDPANLISAELVNQQKMVWEKAGELLGDKIVAVHFKGQNFAADGKRFSTSLEDSAIDYEGAFQMLKKLGQSLPVMREEAVPERAESDKAFMYRFMR